MADPIGSLKRLSNVETKNLGQIMTKALLLPLITAAAVFSDLVEAIIQAPINILDATIAGMSQLITAFLQGPSQFIWEGWITGAEGLGPFGVLAPFVMLGIFLAGGWMVAKYLEEDETSDTIPWTWTDFPLIGTEEEGGD